MIFRQFSHLGFEDKKIVLSCHTLPKKKYFLKWKTGILHIYINSSQFHRILTTLIKMCALYLFFYNFQESCCQFFKTKSSYSLLDLFIIHQKQWLQTNRFYDVIITFFFTKIEGQRSRKQTRLKKRYSVNKFDSF